MRNKEKNETKNTNKRGKEMSYFMKNNWGKIAALLTVSTIGYYVVTLLINTISFAHAVAN